MDRRPWIGVAVGSINFLATFDGIAHNSVYQGILGWSSWVMPMSWAGTAIGLTFYVVNLVFAGITFQQWDAVKIDKLSIDWKTGTIVMVNGLIHHVCSQSRWIEVRSFSSSAARLRLFG